MFEGIAGGIGGAMLEYAAQKKWTRWKIFLYPFFTFSVLGFISFHFFFPWEYGLLLDVLRAVSFGVFSGLIILTGYYFKQKEKK
jgi:hypothetical protein